MRPVQAGQRQREPRAGHVQVGVRRPRPTEAAVPERRALDVGLDEVGPRGPGQVQHGRGGVDRNHRAGAGQVGDVVARAAAEVGHGHPGEAPGGQAGRPAPGRARCAWRPTPGPAARRRRQWPGPWWRGNHGTGGVSGVSSGYRHGADADVLHVPRRIWDRVEENGALELTGRRVGALVLKGVAGVVAFLVLGNLAILAASMWARETTSAGQADDDRGHREPARRRRPRCGGARPPPPRATATWPRPGSGPSSTCGPRRASRPTSRP